MRKILLSLVVFIITLALVGPMGPSPSWATEPSPTSQAAPDTQRFQPETPGQVIKKANEDAERYSKVPPPGGKGSGAESKKSAPQTEDKK
jgi:hypothetical protein